MAHRVGNHRTALAVMAAICVLGGGLVGLVTGRSGSDDSAAATPAPQELPAEKQEMLDLDRELVEQADAAGAPDSPDSVPPVTSCPRDDLASSISDGFAGTPPRGLEPLNSGSLVIGERLYYLMAGGRTDSPNQGQISVISFAVDACRSEMPEIQFAGYRTTTASGPVRLTAIDGDFVSFEVPGTSITGRLNPATKEVENLVVVTPEPGPTQIGENADTP